MTLDRLLRHLVPAGLALAAAAVIPAYAKKPAPLAQVTARLETPPIFDDDAGGNGDADDPAIWVHPSVRDASLVFGTKKNAGLSVYDLGGNELQAITPPAAPGPDDAEGRFNNVDVIYGFRLGGKKVDLAVVTDRGRDKLRFYRIDPAAAVARAAPLVDVTAVDAPLVFSADQAEVNEQATAYGLAAESLLDGTLAIAWVTRRHRPEIAGLVLVPTDDGHVSYHQYRSVPLADTFEVPVRKGAKGKASWTPCTESDEELAQAEGMVIDTERQILYIAHEDVGIWELPLWNPWAKPRLIERVREFGVPYDRVFDAEEEEYICTPRWADDPGVGGRHLSADAEGLSIYYRKGERGYLLASSQGDSTFAAFDLISHEYLGGYAIADGPATDGTQNCDGAMVVSLPMGPRFPQGLLVVHDGNDTPDVLDDEGEVRTSTSFKFVGWEDVARPLGLRIETGGWSPRQGGAGITTGNALTSVGAHRRVTTDDAGSDLHPRRGAAETRCRAWWLDLLGAARQR
jgi:3-phytase